MRPADAHGTVPGATGMAATEIGDAVHRLLELVDLSAPPRRPTSSRCAPGIRRVTDDELDRIRGFVEVYCGSELARRVAGCRASSPSARSPSSTTASCCTAASTSSTVTGRGRSCSTTRRTRSPRARPRRSSRPTTGCNGSSTPSRASGPARTRSRSSTTSSSGPTRSSRGRSLRGRAPAARGGALRCDRAHPGGRVPADAERVHLRRLSRARPRLRRAAAARIRGVRRVAVLSDVHGNLPALDAVLAEVDADAIVCCGDVALGGMPAETLARMREAGAHFVRGNCDRDPGDWVREQLTPEEVDFLAGLPLTVELDVDGLGRVLFCHATPDERRGDLHATHPRRTSWRRFWRTSRRTSSSAATRTCSSTARVDRWRVVNAGSVGMPYEGKPGAFWLLLGPDVDLRVTDYDTAAAADTIEGDGASIGRAVRRLPARPPGSRGDVPVLRVGTCLVASSARHAARVGPKRLRIRPIIERLAAEHADARIALRFRNDVELLFSVMLSAQTTDVNVNRVTERLFEKYRQPRGLPRRAAGGARARHLRDGLLPAEGEVAARDRPHAARGVRRAGAANDAGAAAAARRRPQDRERRRGRARQPAGDRRRHARPPALAAPRADEARGSGEDRARPREARAARRLGPLPAPPDLARPPGVRRAAPAAARSCVVNDLCPSSRVEVLPTL